MWVLNASLYYVLCVCVFSHSVVSDSATPWTVACQAPLSMEFSRQEYWSRLPFPSPGDLLTQGLNPHLLRLLRCRQILYRWAAWGAHCVISQVFYSSFHDSLEVHRYVCYVVSSSTLQAPQERGSWLTYLCRPPLTYYCFLTMNECKLENDYFHISFL